MTDSTPAGLYEITDAEKLIAAADNLIECPSGK